MDGIREVHITWLQAVEVTGGIEIDIPGETYVTPDTEPAFPSACRCILCQNIEVRAGALNRAVIAGEPSHGLLVLTGAVSLGVLMGERAKFDRHAPMLEACSAAVSTLRVTRRSTFSLAGKRGSSPPHQVGLHHLGV